uniref:uncharacterized protein LOC120333414 n=1 Tax=Styela clava TaxID=7725 RepID=UPI0019395B45|nr:uncharacterized protein LOC120333414 [Styela clava]
MKNKHTASRAKSLPADPRIRNKERKLKGRVSFSSRPPIKIEFDSDATEYNASPIPKEQLFTYKCEQFRNEKKESRCYTKNKDHLLVEIPKKVERDCSNDLDSVNEMLMDILEEIEVENITIEDCLRDAVYLQILEEEDAKDVIPTFTVEKYNFTYENDNNNNNKASINSDKESENSTQIDKLLDIFSALPTKDLAKCCKYTLGKLCQLTSYEDYEHIQKIAASVCESFRDSPVPSIVSEISHERSRNWSNDSYDGSFFTDSSNDTNYLSSGSSENFEYLSSESERDFKIDAKCLEIPNEHSVNTVKDILPVLVEEGILQPRQVWGILELPDQNEMLKRLIKEMSNSTGSAKLEKVVNTFSFPNIKNIIACSRISEDSDSSTNDSDYGSNSSENETSSCGKTNSKKTSLSNLKVSKRFGLNKTKTTRPFTISSEWKQRERNNPITSTPEKTEEIIITKHEHGCPETWCHVNNLLASTASVLRHHGYLTEEEISNITELDMNKFSELSWPEKVKLWIAIEGLKLDKMYIECRRKLTSYSKTFENFPVTHC